MGVSVKQEMAEDDQASQQTKDGTLYPRRRITADDELTLVHQSRAMAKRRRTRRRTITTLPDHVREQLVQAFSQVDVEGTGQVHRLKLVEIVKEAYKPTKE